MALTSAVPDPDTTLDPGTDTFALDPFTSGIAPAGPDPYRTWALDRRLRAVTADHETGTFRCIECKSSETARLLQIRPEPFLELKKMVALLLVRENQGYRVAPKFLQPKYKSSDPNRRPMSIEQTNVVDFVSIDLKTDRVVLTISDHLPWDEKGTHLKLLQDKLNAYLAFIESGELQERYPKAVGRKAVISIHGKFPLSEQATLFMDMATPVIRNAGFDLQFRLFNPMEE